MIATPAESPRGFLSLDGMTLADKERFNTFGRGPEIAIPFDVVHHAFEAIAKNNPNITAIRDADDTEITYAELEDRANILALELIRRYKLKKGDRVVLVYSRCIEMVIFLLAVLKAGGQYVPLDGGVTPGETLSHIISDSGATVILCLPKFRSKVDICIPRALQEIVEVFELDRSSKLWSKPNQLAPPVEVKPSDGAYVIYTSGTTGKPKGVDVSHEGISNTLLSEPTNLGITIGSNVIQQLNVGFDMAAWEILGTVMNGGTLNIRGSGREAWVNCLRRVDTVIATPSVLLKHVSKQQDFPNIRTIAVAGEPCPKSLADHWSPHVKFWNTCGPTEISIVNSAHLHTPGSSLSIGKPIPNTSIYILDENEGPVEIGKPGVMWAGGRCVSRGYLNQPALMASRYKVDKFASNGRLMFNTGDLARWLEDGSLEPLGRIDDQVKVSGFRVELDGVSRMIERFDTISKACALKIDEQLWGFYAAPAAVDHMSLQKSLTDVLPFYAIPTRWTCLSSLALTSNGKIDKKKLRKLASEAIASDTACQTSIVPVLVRKDRPSNSTLGSTEDVDMNQTDSTLNVLRIQVAQSPVLTTKHLVEALNVMTGSCSDSDSTDFGQEKSKSEYTLPPKNGFHGWRWLRHRALSAYRKLFGLIFIANMIPLIVMLWRSRHHGFLLPLPSLITAVASNLLAAVLVRQDHVVNTIFFLATRLPLPTPFFLRRHFARIYHNGGVHSGCGVFATIWWVISAVETSRYYFRTDDQSGIHYHVNDAMMVITYLILALLMGILAMAYPTLRARMHDQFEWTHRFAGWTTLILVWVHLIVSTYSLQAGREDIGQALARTPGLYLITFITLSIASPWLALRKVKVVAEPLSRHAVRLHFDFFTPRPSSSVGVRITDRPLVEWHAFAAIFEPGKDGFSLIVSRAGDWTSKIIDKPPTTLWTRGTPASGVLAIAPLFKKIVLVSTGSGIGPCMPVILERRVPCRILWSTKNPLKTYGQEIISEIYKTDRDAVVWDTDERGRPNLAALAYQIYRESDAECVCIISNARTTSKLVYDLESRGVPAFGPIWDS